MTTLRIARRRQFVRTDARAVNDPRLSFRAVGLLVWLLEKPDDWSVRSESIGLVKAEGRDAVRAALRELEVAGYVVRVKRQVAGGRWVTETTVYEHPSLVIHNDPAGDGIPGVGAPGVGLPGAGNPGAKSLTNQTHDVNEPPNPRKAGAEPAGSSRARGVNPRAVGTNPRAGDDAARLRRYAEQIVDAAARVPGVFGRIAWLVYEAPGGPHWDGLVAAAVDELEIRGEGTAPTPWAIADMVEASLGVLAPLTQAV